MTIPTPLTRNVTKLFRTATDAEIETGMQWYADANEIATALALKNGMPVETATGVIAALSPLNSWGANVNLAARFLSTPGGLYEGYLFANLAKARRILTADAADIPAILGGDKTQNFYRSILTAGADGVCVDRHAISLAINERLNDKSMPKLKGRSYETFAEVYRRAAAILRPEYGLPLTAAMVQSVTWVKWRTKFWAVGAFDGHEVTL